MKWVNSAGGPLLLIAEDHLSSWRGTVGREDERSDYDRACLVDDLIGSIKVGDGLGIILNDEPYQTAWLLSETHDHGYLIRWRRARDESSVIRCLGHVRDAVLSSELTDFKATCSRCILFDSALPGYDFRKGEFLEIMLAPGEYGIQTGLFEPDPETSLVIHRFRKRNKPGTYTTQAAKACVEWGQT